MCLTLWYPFVGNDLSIMKLEFSLLHPNFISYMFSSSSATTKATSLLGRSLSNNERSERIRKALKYTKVPVLRNRKRTFFFVESVELDGFGPGSAMLGPPEEMSPGELNEDGGMGGRTSRGSDNVDPKLGIDLVQSFPYSKP